MRMYLKMAPVSILLVTLGMNAQVPPKTREQLETLIYSVKGQTYFRLIVLLAMEKMAGGRGHSHQS